MRGRRGRRSPAGPPHPYGTYVRTLVTGVSGYVGAALAPALLDAGHAVRGFARDPGRVTVPGIPLVRGDALTGAGLDAALEGIDVAYYLIHSMEAAAQDGFAASERRATETFLGAARRAGVSRVVYFGGLVPPGAAPSPHLASRLAVEREVLAGIPDSIALRASIVIGARSRSFRFLVRLVERLPVLALPAWHERRTQPIDGRDVIAFLVAAVDSEEAGGGSFDIAGPEVLTYGAIIERIRDLMLLDRPTLRLDALTLTPVASRVAAAIAGEHHALIGPLMAGLEHDLLPRDGTAARVLGVRLHSFDAAVERALRDWERDERLAAR
jgi:uncharacterized protein YbjT (DUF2867 family)